MVIDIYDTVQQLQDPGTMPQWAGPFPCHQGTNNAPSAAHVRHTKITATDTTTAEAVTHTHWQEQKQQESEQAPAHQEWFATGIVVLLAAIMAYFIGRQFK